MRLERPIRWLEDRREHLISGANCREHYYEVTGYAAADGELLAVDCEALVDSGAYSCYPVFGLSRGGASDQHSARALSHARLSLHSDVSGHEQARASCRSVAWPGPASVSPWS